MKRYAVVFEESAQADVRESYDWGRRAWGKHEVQLWVRQLRTAVSEQLAVVPKAFPLAPEDEEFSEEIRQMVVGAIAYCSQSRAARSTCSTLEERISDLSDQKNLSNLALRLQRRLQERRPLAREASLCW